MKTLCYILIISGAAAGILTGCNSEDQTDRQIKWNKALVVTVDHDGHLFIINLQGGILHSPACPFDKK